MEAIVQNVQSGCLKECCEVAVVFANKSSAKGLAVAQQLGIATAWIASKGRKRQEFDEAVVDLLAPLAIDYIVLAGYMRIVSKPLIRAYPRRIINIHPADTHAFKGLGAYQWAFEQQLNSTKITVHYVDEGVDTGAIIAQAEVDLTGTKTLAEVEERGLKVEHSFYSQALKGVFSMAIA